MDNDIIYGFKAFNKGLVNRYGYKYEIGKLFADVKSYLKESELNVVENKRPRRCSHQYDSKSR